MRRQLTFTIPGQPGDTVGTRDNGKTFLLTEMPADQAERWAMRLLLGAQQSGVEVPANFQEAGMASVAEVGLRALTGLPWAVAEPLLDEMMGCVQYVPTAAGVGPQALLRGSACQIEDVSTRLKLRLKLFELHTGFSLPESPPTSG
jgi:hypothetical protein